MPKNKKGQIFYQVTKDKPQGLSHVLLLGGSVGTALSFFIVSVLGALNGIEMNDWVLYFILAAIIGFVAGTFLTLLFVRNFSKVVSTSAATDQSTVIPQGTEAAVEQPVTSEGPTVVPGEEDKGQSVDFVFPELSPDK
jgi:hypothetical protein